MSPDRKPSTTDPHQLPLFAQATQVLSQSNTGDPPPVSAITPLSVARIWFRQHLISLDHPSNTVESYVYDLVVLEQRIGDKEIYRYTETDIAIFLGNATSKVTRKRRLTSLKAFFRFLMDDLHVLQADPTRDFSPHPLEHKRPQILTPDEQDCLLDAARDDEPWSAPAIWLMLYLGIGRTELLALHPDHIDRTTEGAPTVLIAYDAPGKLGKQRTLHATPEFGEMYATFIGSRQTEGRLFPVGPQAVNGMVERVAKTAGLQRRITPQLLRHTAAVRMASGAHTVNDLLAMLGLANDARNRETIRMYLSMAEEVTSCDPTSEEP